MLVNFHTRCCIDQVLTWLRGFFRSGLLGMDFLNLSLKIIARLVLLRLVRILLSCCWRVEKLQRNSFRSFFRYCKNQSQNWGRPCLGWLILLDWTIIKSRLFSTCSSIFEGYSFTMNNISILLKGYLVIQQKSSWRWCWLWLRT